ncbi:unnamed protein product [Rhizopus stolonifer]
MDQHDNQERISNTTRIETSSNQRSITNSSRFNFSITENYRRGDTNASLQAGNLKGVWGPGFRSHIFTILKKSDDLRSVLKLRPLNQYIPSTNSFQDGNDSISLSTHQIQGLSNQYRFAGRILYISLSTSIADISCNSIGKAKLFSFAL